MLVLTENNALEKGIKQPLLTSLKDKVDEDDDQDYEDSEEAPEDSHQPANSIGAAYRLLTPSVKVGSPLTISLLEVCALSHCLNGTLIFHVRHRTLLNDGKVNFSVPNIVVTYTHTKLRLYLQDGHFLLSNKII